tara:strand:- start:815 stop:1147 length:333 start_codon:yes stop_codon:yes gene_type:complete
MDPPLGTAPEIITAGKLLARIDACKKKKLQIGWGRTTSRWLGNHLGKVGEPLAGERLEGKGWGKRVNRRARRTKKFKKIIVNSLNYSVKSKRRMSLIFHQLPRHRNDKYI